MELNAELLGGGITAETERSSQFFLDFEVVDENECLEYQSESHLQCPSPKDRACKELKT